MLSGPNGGIGGSFNAFESTITPITVEPALLDAAGNFVENESVAGGLTFTPTLAVAPSTLGTLSATAPTFTGGVSSAALNFTASNSNTGAASISITQQPSGFTIPTSVSTTLNVSVQQSGLVPPSGITVGQNLEINTNIALAGGGHATSPITVTVTSLDATKLLFANNSTDPGSASITLTIPTGQTHTLDFWIFGYANTGSVQYTIAGTGLGTITTAMPMGPSGLQINNGQSIGLTLGNGDATLNISTALLDGSGNILAFQSPAGNMNVSATVTSSNTNTGTITTSPVTISGGSSSATTSFHPVGSGTSIITASATSFKSASITASVNTPTLSVNNQLTVGQFLEQQGSVILSAHAPGLQITLTSNNPSLLKLAVNPTDPGSTSITLTVDSNGDNPTFWVYGEAGSGSATYTASATNWNSGTDTVNLAPSGVFMAGGIWPNALCFGSLACNVSLASGSYTFSVVTGQLATDGSNTFVGAQPMAGDAAPITVGLHYGNGQVGTVPGSTQITPGTQQALATFTPTGAGTELISLTEPSGWFVPTSSFGNLNVLSMKVQ